VSSSAPLLFAFLIASQAFGQGVTFKEEVKLVEVYATVFDHHGKAVNGLTREQFEIRDDGTPQPIRTFEPTQGALSCALLLDTTGSMAPVMPQLRNGAKKFIGALRPGDSVGVYSFTDHVEELQGITADQDSSKKALSRLHAGGRTALFDSVSQLIVELERMKGKKVIVVLTDGGDNASSLSREAAEERARKAGVPVFAIAEGEALHDEGAAGLLRDLAESTGGRMYKANRSKDMETILQAIARDVQYGYLLGFKAPPEGKKNAWHELQVVVKNTAKPLQVRARTGYLIE